MKKPIWYLLRTRWIDNASHEQYRTGFIVLDEEYERMVCPEYRYGLRVRWRVQSSVHENPDYPSFFIASALRFFGISSIAYRSAVRGISFLCFIT